MENRENIILNFGDKRHRENRLRRSIVSIDDTDYLMEVRSARCRSIKSITNDDLDLGPRNPTNWNRVWNNFNISPDNIRNILPLNNQDTIDKKGEDNISRNPIPDLSPGKGNTEISNTADHSYSSKRQSPQSVAHHPSTTTSAIPEELQHPAWYNRLGAISRRERQQEKAYYDTLDAHHEVSTVRALKRNQNNPYCQYWLQWNSSRDGMDFSREVALALRHESIYAMADSLTQLPPCDLVDSNEDTIDENNNEKLAYNNGYFQDTRPAAKPKTKKCVLDLIS